MNDENATNDEPEGPQLWAKRDGTARYIAYNSRGASVEVGAEGVDGVFSPGELLQLALATCESLSADHRLKRALGDDFDATITAAGEAHPNDNRYTDIHTELIVDMSELDGDQEEKLRERVEAAVRRHCTVSRTLDASAASTMEITSEPPQ